MGAEEPGQRLERRPRPAAPADPFEIGVEVQRGHPLDSATKRAQVARPPGSGPRALAAIAFARKLARDDLAIATGLAPAARCRPRPRERLPAGTDAMLTLRPGALTLSELRALWAAPAPLALDPAARPAVDAAARCVDRVIASGETVYGVNTGFGLLARTPHRRRAARRAAARAGAVAFGRHRRAARRRGRAPRPRAQGRLARARALGRALERDRGAGRARQRRRRALHPGAGLGRRVGRSRPARAPRLRADRRGRGEGRRPHRARRATRSPRRGWSRSCWGRRRAWRCSTARRCRRRWRSRGSSPPSARSPARSSPAR